jgi:large subunit ribosomal protein L10
MAKNEKENVNKEKVRKNIEQKMREAEALLKEVKNYKAFMILNLRKTPALLQQRLRKALKQNNGNMKAVRKPIITRVLKEQNINKEIDFPAAIVLSNEHPYNIYKIIKSNQLEVAAKPNDIAPFDIVIPAGETDLQPGPALSQLKAAGLNVKIEKGKIVIAKDSVIAKKGEVITPEKAQALQMLGIKPFKVGLNVVFGYDGKSFYETEILSIDKETIKDQLLQGLKDVINASININVPTPLSVKFIFIKAIKQARNATINASIYNDTFIKDLLINAINQGNAINKRVAQ